METEVFSYFFLIGSGLALGLSFGAIPAVIAYQYNKRKGGYYGSQAKKART